MTDHYPASAGSPSVFASLFRRKAAADVLRQAGRTEDCGGLRRSLGVWRLALFGVSATIGTGIFFIFSIATPMAGPAIIMSFVLAGVTAGLSALCYAELASAFPVAGAGYSCAFVAFGEIIAFIVAACLVLEYAVSVAAIAVSWSEYLNAALLTLTGWRIPEALSAAPGQGCLINLPAVVLVGLCCMLLSRGARETATANAIMTLIKLGILAMFTVIAFTGFEVSRFTPFAPLGMGGVSAAAALIFFSYVGIDSVATAAEEAEDPSRTTPRATLIAMAIVTSIYILVAVAAIGAQDISKFAGQEAGLAAILAHITGARWPSLLLTLGAVISIFSVSLVVLYSQTRILLAVSRDGLIPSIFQRIRPSTGTPVWNTWIVGVVVAAAAGFLQLDILAEMTSIGTLVVLVVISLAVIRLRTLLPDMPRRFRVPGYPVTPIVSAALCLYLIVSLRTVTFGLFAIWMAAALAFYVLYSFPRSILAKNLANGTANAPAQNGTEAGLPLAKISNI